MLELLQTQRLILRTVTVRDAASIFEYASVPGIDRFVKWNRHETIDDTLAFINDYALPHYCKNIPDPYCITLKDCPDKVIGTVGAFWSSDRNKNMEMGYVISEGHRNRGFVTEACLGLLDYLFKNYDVNRVQATCNEENSASERVMQKLGMTYEGTMRDYLLVKNCFWNVKMYSILRRDFTV